MTKVVNKESKSVKPPPQQTRKSAKPAPTVSTPAPIPVSKVLTHPLASTRVPLGPLHPPLQSTQQGTQQGTQQESAGGALLSATPRLKRPGTIAEKLICLRTTDVTLAEISLYMSKPGDHSTLAVGCSNNLLWLIRDAASKRRLTTKQLVIGCILQALSEDPTPGQDTGPGPDPNPPGMPDPSMGDAG